MSRRFLMAGSEALRAAALAAILLLIWLGALNLPLLALLGFAAVCGTVVYSVAAPALVPSLVNSQQLPAANARIELARTVAFAAGPRSAARWSDGSALPPPLASLPRSPSSPWWLSPASTSLGASPCRAGTRSRRSAKAPTS